MDISLRIRILIWITVISLWGAMLYQDIGQSSYLGKKIFSEGVSKRGDEDYVDPEKLAAAGAAAGKALAQSEKASGINSPSSLDLITPLKGAEPAYEQSQEPRPQNSEPVQDESSSLSAVEPSAPNGFFLVETKHFNIYAEGHPPSKSFISMAENLHKNLMIDLAAFSPWAEEGRVSIFLFQDAKSYHLVTGRPEWSGGASAVSERKLYVYKSRELTGILAHELCHIYYDGFYIGGHPDPLWLSEGMATMIQVERGFARPQWLRDNLKVIEEGGGYSLKDLMAVTTMGNAPTSEIQLWYTESYSLVHYLFREHYPSMFYRFSKYIRNGYPVRESLYQAYGMPFNKISSLEYAWRASLTGKIPSLSATN